MKDILCAHGVAFRKATVQSHNKAGVVERTNATVKRILERFQLDSTAASDANILAIATFLSNVFSGSKLLSSFELAKG